MALTRVERMRERISNDPTCVLPSYKKWTTFLAGQDKARVEIDKHRLSATLNYTTPAGVLNSVDYRGNAGGDDFQPYCFVQKYDRDGYNVDNILNNDLLSSDVGMPLKGGKLVYAAIMSKASRVKSGWVKGQQVFMSLGQEYLRQLIKEGAISHTSGQRIWIERGQDGVVKATIAEGAGQSPLADETLRKICAEVGLDFELLADKTTVAIGDITYTLPNVEVTSLNRHTVWQSLTGKGNLSIFPVEVSVADQ